MAEYRKYKSDEDKVKVYEHRLNQAEEQNKKWHPMVQKHFARYEAEKRAMAMTANGHNIAGSTPMVVGNIDSLFSSMTAAEIDLSLTPKGQTTDEQAYVAQAALAEEWDHAKVNERGEEGIKDSIIGGIGFLKVGYEYIEVEREVPREAEDVRREVISLLEQAEAAGREAPDQAYIEANVPLMETRGEVLSDRIVVDYVPWDMLLWDPTAKRWGDIRWVAQKQLVPTREVKENPLYQEYCARRRQSKKLQELAADGTVDKAIIGEMADPTEEDERVTVYTIWDFETGTICTWAKDTDFLLNETVNAFSIFPDVEDKNPFVPYVGRATSTRVRGISEMDVLKPIAEEVDLYHSRLGTYLERMAPKVLAKSRAFTPAGKKGMRSQEVGTVVELEEGFDPSSDVKELVPPRLMSEMYEMPARLEQMGRDATGVSELMRGLFPDRKRTATETTEVVSASAARQSEKRNRLTHFWEAVAYRMLWLMMMYYDKPRIAKLADDAGDFDWEWTAEDIVGSYKIEVSLTPVEPKTWQARSDKALAVLNVVGPLAQAGADGSSPADLTELLRYVLTELNIPRRVIRSILNLPEEQQQQVMGNLQKQAAMAQAQGGLTPNPAMVPGPLDAGALAAATNQGAIPPEVLAASQGVTPTSPEAVERVSEAFSTPRV